MLYEVITVFLDAPERRIPNEGGIDVTAFPGGGDRWRLHVEDLDLIRLDAELFEGKQQVKVGGRHEGHSYNFV